MPTETFFNLSTEKKDRILRAARKEFSSVSLKEASISNIIREADIPRGSFYQYFEGKEDLYFYYFHSIGRDSYRVLIEAIKKADGDLFAAFEHYFSSMIIEIFKGENVRFYKNLFMSMDYHGLRKVTPLLEETPKSQKNQCHHKKKHQKIFEVVDKSLLKVNNNHELDLLLQMMMHTVFSTIADGYRQRNEDETYDVEAIQQNFSRKFNWLKNGAKKRNFNEKGNGR